jgi:hypothetical protein
MRKIIIIVTLLSVIILITISYAGKIKQDIPSGKYKLICIDSIFVDYPKSYLVQGVNASHLSMVRNGYIWKDAGVGSYHQFDLKGKLLHSYVGQYRLCPDQHQKSYKKIPLRVGSVAVGNKQVYIYDDLTQHWFVYDMQGNFIKRLNRMQHVKHSNMVGSPFILTTNDSVIFIPLTDFDKQKRYTSPLVYMVDLNTGKTLKKFLEPDSMLLKYKDRLQTFPSTFVPIEVDFAQKELYTAHSHDYHIYKYNYITGQKIAVFGEAPPNYHTHIPMPDMDYSVMTAKVVDTLNLYNRKNWHYSPFICYNSKHKIIARVLYAPPKLNKRGDSYLQLYKSTTGELITQIQLPENYSNLCYITDDLEFWIENKKYTKDDPYIIYKTKLVPEP